jgi:DNA invertase Pin-like site-specific DNA recombinase
VTPTLLAECRKLGIVVIPVDAGQDLVVADDDPTRVLIRQVLGAVAQFEKSILVTKAASGTGANSQDFRPMRAAKAVWSKAR